MLFEWNWTSEHEVISARSTNFANDCVHALYEPRRATGILVPGNFYPRSPGLKQHRGLRKPNSTMRSLSRDGRRGLCERRDRLGHIKGYRDDLCPPTC